MTRCSASGEPYEPEDVLDEEELSSYRRHQSQAAHYRLARFARTGILPPSIGERREEADMDRYERYVMGE